MTAEQCFWCIVCQSKITLHLPLINPNNLFTFPSLTPLFSHTILFNHAGAPYMCPNLSLFLSGRWRASEEHWPPVGKPVSCVCVCVPHRCSSLAALQVFVKLECTEYLHFTTHTYPLNSQLVYIAYGYSPLTMHYLAPYLNFNHWNWIPTHNEF